MTPRFELALRAKHHPYDREGEPVSHFSVIGDWEVVGTIHFRVHLARDEMPWAWSVTVPLSSAAQRTMATSGREASREDAMRAFRRSYERVRIAIGEEGWSDFVERCRRLRAIDEQSRRGRAPDT